MKSEKITFRLDAYLMSRIQEYAQSRIGVPISVIIRDLIIAGLEASKPANHPDDRRFRRMIIKGSDRNKNQ